MNQITNLLKRTKFYVKNIMRLFFIILGILSFTLILLSFTDIPYYAYYNLGVSQTKLCEEPNVIVLLGGSGMPSPDGLIRTYYTAEAAKKFYKADIIIAHPNGKNNCSYQSGLMANELIAKGVDPLRLKYETKGFNTRSQAKYIADMLKIGNKQNTVLIITSPSHMYRSVKTFKKLGFKKVGGVPTFEKPIAEQQLLKCIKTERVNLSFRYNMWSYLQYEILVLREYCAIVYYKFKGWI